MKQNDIIVIIIVIFIGGIVSFVVSNALFSGAQDTKSAVVVDPISTEFKTPDGRYFSVDSVDPTRQIDIGAQTTETPNTD